MTKRRAETIMQLTVTITEENRGFKARASDEKRKVCAHHWAPTMSAAIAGVVSTNYRRICWLVSKQQRYRCAVCHRQVGMQFHHKIHRSQGRRLDTEENIEGLCVRCHGAEHGQRMKE